MDAPTTRRNDAAAAPRGPAAQAPCAAYPAARPNARLPIPRTPERLAHPAAAASPGRAPKIFRGRATLPDGYSFSEYESTPTFELSSLLSASSAHVVPWDGGQKTFSDWDAVLSRPDAAVDRSSQRSNSVGSVLSQVSIDDEPPQF